MFNDLKKINQRPKPFEFYTADELWTNEHTSKQMLDCHLNEEIDLSSRKREFIDRSAAWIASRFELGNHSKVIDFGCGPGLYTTLLAETGASVTGVDFSQNSIAYARRVAEDKNLKIDYIHANYLNFETHRKFDLAMMIMWDFCALSPAQRKTLLGIFNSVLNNRGALLLDVLSLNSFNGKSESASYELNQLNHFWASDDYYSFLNTFKYEKEKVSLDKYTIVEESQTRVVYNWMQHYSQETLKAEFQENGFELENIYLNVAGDAFDQTADEFAVVARKI